jgi:uncharacterized small protein (DUF1192 family)
MRPEQQEITRLKRKLAKLKAERDPACGLLGSYTAHVL